MYQDYKDLLSAFHAHGVKYLIVGGYAVIFHAQPRFTKDLDFFIGADPGNANATFAALASFGGFEARRFCGRRLLLPLRPRPQGIRHPDRSPRSRFPFRVGPPSRRRYRRCNGSEGVLHFQRRSDCRKARLGQSAGSGRRRGCTKSIRQPGALGSGPIKPVTPRDSQSPLPSARNPKHSSSPPAGDAPARLPQSARLAQL